jgi:hypothetical protein
VYALNDSGQLARVDRRGHLTGVFATQLTSLAVTRDFVCGRERSGRVVCARDSHHDATCPSAALAAFRSVALLPDQGATLISRGGGRQLCLARAGKALLCIPGDATCNRPCLAFPACAPPRCVDPCPAGRDG